MYVFGVGYSMFSNHQAWLVNENCEYSFSLGMELGPLVLQLYGRTESSFPYFVKIFQSLSSLFSD